MHHDQTLADVLSVVRERIVSYGSSGIGEQNTKAGLIARVLRALGWDVEDLREVHMEYRPRAADKPVDYALMINSQARMFVEAKALGQNLEDRRWANQIIGYAGVRKGQPSSTVEPNIAGESRRPTGSSIASSHQALGWPAYRGRAASRSIPTSTARRQGSSSASIRSLDETSTRRSGD